MKQSIKNNQKINKKSELGITLLNLVIIIILIIILSSIAINIVIGDEGLFEYAKQAKKQHQISQYVENIEIARGEVQVNNFGIATLDNLLQRIKEKDIISGGQITKLDEERAEAVTKEGYIIIITADGTIYDRTESVDPVPELKEGDIVFSIEPEKWTNENVKVSIKNNIEGNYILKYSLDKVNWIKYTEPVEISKNINIFACVENIIGEQGKHTSMLISNIDKLAPETFEPNITVTSNTIEINAEEARDAEATEEYGESGIKEIQYSKDGGSSWQTNENKANLSYTYDNLEQTTEYFVGIKVIDEAGNETIIEKTIETEKVTTADEGNIIISEPTWNTSTHKASVTITKGSSVKSSLQVQYQVVTSLSNISEENWKIGTSVGNLNHNDYVCARLWDGNNGGDYASVQVKDTLPPTVTVNITETGINNITASASAIDNQYGMATTPTFVFYIKKTEDPDSAYTQGQNLTNTTCKFTNLIHSTNYTVKVTTTDIAENMGEGTDSTTTLKATYTVSYNANGGSGAPGAQIKTHGENLILSSTQPARSGYTFLGWSTSSSASTPTYSAGSVYSRNENVTLYAVWKKITYTVSYNANGGSGAPGAQTKIYGENLTLSSTQPSRSGYSFLGWSGSSSASSPTYSAGGTYSANANATLYAVWKKLGFTHTTYSVTCNNGAASSGSYSFNTNGYSSIQCVLHCEWYGDRWESGYAWTNLDNSAGYDIIVNSTYGSHRTKSYGVSPNSGTVTVTWQAGGYAKVWMVITAN